MKVNKWIINNLLHMGGFHCVLCGAASKTSFLCGACQGELPVNRSSCYRCAIPLPDVSGELICGDCQQHAPLYQRAYSFAIYAPPLDRMIQQLKFQQKLHFARLLGDLVANDVVARQLPLPDVLIPVPLHAQRLRHRGYNQALELARPLAKALSVPIDTTSCKRHKATNEQSGLHARQRKSNMKDAFTVNAGVNDKSVVIFDDVMTTGTTVNEMARELLRAGARDVDVWVCARATL